MFKAHRLVYHSTLGSRVIKKKKELTLEAGLLAASVRVIPPAIFKRLVPIPATAN